MISSLKQAPVFIGSGTLPASGSFTGSITLPCNDFHWATLYLTYTTGSTSGSVQFYCQGSPDGVVFFDKLLQNGNVAAASPKGFTSTVATNILQVQAAGNLTVQFPFAILGDTQIKFQFAEYGVVGTPGTFVASCSFCQTY